MDERWWPIEQPAGPPLTDPADPAEVDSLRRGVYESYEGFLRTRLAELDRERPSRWRRDYRSHRAYIHSVAPMRRRLAAMLGFWVEPGDRSPVRVPASSVWRTEPGCTVRRFRMEILPGLETYGLDLMPTTPPPHPGLLVQHGYGGTPELACGFAETANDEDYAYRSLGIRAAERGYRVVAIHHPTSWGSLDETARFPLHGFPQHPGTYGKNRLHRLAIIAGGTLFGLDMMASSRAIDYLLQVASAPADRIGMYGLSQGGQSAMYLPALDPRIRASVSSAYFNTRLPKMIGPHRTTTYLDSAEEDKFFVDVVRLFGDADLVSLIAPRAFAVEAGLLDGAVDFDKAQAEFARAAEHWARLGVPDRAEFIAHREAHVSATGRTLAFLAEHLRADAASPTPMEEPDVA